MTLKRLACSHGEAVFPKCGRDKWLQTFSVYDRASESAQHPENKMVSFIAHAEGISVLDKCSSKMWHVLGTRVCCGSPK